MHLFQRKDRGRKTKEEKSLELAKIREIKAYYKQELGFINEEKILRLGKLLGVHGYNVRLAHTGQEALAAVDVMHPHAILLDIGLPDMNGYDVARAIRRAGNTTMLIALTGYGAEEDQREARDAGFDHHLTKPIGFLELEACLRELKA